MYLQYTSNNSKMAFIISFLRIFRGKELLGPLCGSIYGKNYTNSTNSFNSNGFHEKSASSLVSWSDSKPQACGSLHSLSFLDTTILLYEWNQEEGQKKQAIPHLAGGKIQAFLHLAGKPK